ncbi:ferredoxin-fold anticodon-binding domain-containing protein 1-like [Ptychodera flava]|uniref:ferredoxin-fold anticodon-binding domain-containing protein 1-like n=1 Tax=Ptychodera flava TaxID=63121 RepID=UPI00396A42CA
MTASSEPIYYTKSGKILMLGEGDFSFSKSLLRYVNNPRDVIATTYETEETLQKHKNAAGNVDELQHKGVTVLYNVDATSLANSAGLKGLKFMYIIFNFPHVGGKASVGQNRKLLKAVFLSCADFLHHEGEIHITLCGGQGGTPADKPQRQWGNSWQVVAMAAYAGLILSSTATFDPVNYPEYTCTGFRSQDKPFFTKGGIIHIFVKSLPIPMELPDAVEINAVIGEKRMVFQCPPSLAEFINRDLFTEESHPIQIMKDALMGVLRSAYKDLTVFSSDQLSVVVGNHGNVNAYELSVLSEGEVREKTEDCHEVGEDGCVTGSDTGSVCDPCGVAVDENGPSCVQECKQSGDEIPCIVEHGSCIDQKRGSVNCHPTIVSASASSQEHKNIHVCNESGSPGKYFLRSDLLVHASDIVSQSDSSYHVLWGRVFSQCTIKPGNFPIKHQLLLLARSTHSTVKGDITALLHSLLGGDAEISFEEFFTDGRCGSHESWQLIDNILRGTAIKVTKHGEATSVGNLNFADGEIIFVSFWLDALAMLTFRFTDVRLMWTNDNRCCRNFRCKLAEVSQDASSAFPFLKMCNLAFESYSLYAPTYIHDISLWESPGLPRLQESAFFSTLREVCHHQVLDVFLKDQYVHPKTGSRSRCYRMTYTSADRALSKTEATELQIQFRQVLRDRLGVYLR